MTSRVPQAEGIKRVREGKVPPAGGAGSSGARPKRYRGYYRAAKRGEPWAVNHFKLGPFGRLMDRYMGHLLENLFKQETKGDFFLSKELNDPWTGGQLVVPFGKK